MLIIDVESIHGVPGAHGISQGLVDIEKLEKIDLHKNLKQKILLHSGASCDGHVSTKLPGYKQVGAHFFVAEHFFQAVALVPEWCEELAQ